MDPDGQLFTHIPQAVHLFLSGFSASASSLVCPRKRGLIVNDLPRILGGDDRLEKGPDRHAEAGDKGGSAFDKSVDHIFRSPPVMRRFKKAKGMSPFQAKFRSWSKRTRG